MEVDGRSSNLGDRLRAGRQLLRGKHKAGDALKLGNLRAGNSGIMSPEGDVAGSCHRVAHLRALGIDLEEPEDSKLIMFQMGTANEDVVYGDLVQTAGPDEVILRETEIPTLWFTTNGVKVTGRPDMVICRRVDKAGPGTTPVPEALRGSNAASHCEPCWGVELKSIASVWTTREVLFDGMPKMAHLIQASHYAWQLDVPFRLMYKQYVNQVVPAWAQKMFPRQGKPGSEHVVYNEKGEIKNINPFEIVYELEVTKAGAVRYRRESMDGAEPGPWTSTLIKHEDIRRFYEAASRIGQTGDLGKRPLTIDAQGKEKSFSNCGYCPLKKVCDKVDKTSKARPAIGYEQWLEEVKAVTATIGTQVGQSEQEKDAS